VPSLPDHDAAHFRHLATLLRREGVGVPAAIVDVARVRQNAARVKTWAGERFAVRISDKSVPCQQLIALLRDTLGTERHMVFHLPFLRSSFEAFPSADVLAGKPFPTFAIEKLLSSVSAPERAKIIAQTTWLVDTEARLAELASLARTHELSLRVSLEIDVGLHRGGFSLEHFDRALVALTKANDALKLVGLMGYDAHVGKSPLRGKAASHAASLALYQAFADKAAAMVPKTQLLQLNGAGSPTFHHHDVASPLREVSMGSIFLKPCDFDLPELDGYTQAAWIAAPVLKVLEGLVMPDHPLLSRAMTAVSTLTGAAFSKTVFYYGGRWDSRPVYPHGAREHPIYTGSFNQGCLSMPAHAAIAVDDYVFFRPVQTESILLRFGDLFAVDGDRVERWPVLPSA
jgi:D-serine deaminase-like pyridoxal phosphate-dependent protein